MSVIQTYEVHRTPTGELANHSFLIFIRDVTGSEGVGLPDLTYNEVGLVCYRYTSFLAPELVTLTDLLDPNGAHSDNGFAPKSNSLAPGMYRFDPHNDYFDDFEGEMFFEFRGAADMEATRLKIVVTPEPTTVFDSFWQPNCSLAYDHTIQRIRILGFLHRAGVLYQNAISATFTLYEEGNSTPIATVTNNTPATVFWADMDNIALNPDNVYMMEFSITDAAGEVHIGGVGVATLD